MDWIELLRGITIFIYGVQLANDSRQRRAGDQLRRDSRPSRNAA
jgi:Na+/phosphate symporter